VVSKISTSIVIPVINESKQLPIAIDRAWEAGAGEVIIADGGSRDGTQAIAETSQCVLVESKPGRGIQLNAGARQATGDIILFLHVDNWLVKNGCQQIAEAMTDSNSRAGFFKQRIESRKLIYRLIEKGNQWRGQYQRLVYGDQAMFIESTLFRELGGFPDITIMEDFAFSQAIRSHTNFVMLEGPTFVSPRRWEKHGPFRQTATNWLLSSAFRLGASPEWIAQRYRRHDN
jgi:rSAM/selenodomain-associated transferase 2